MFRETLGARSGARLVCPYFPVPSVCLVMSNSFVTPWTVACQAPPVMEFSRQEYWSGLPFPFPGDLPSSGIEPGDS